MGQTIFAVQVFGEVTQCIGFGEQVAFVVVTRLPGAGVRVADLGHQGRQVVILVGDLAAQRVGFFEQAGVFVVRPSTLDGEVAGVEARPSDGHQSRQAEVDFIGDQFAARGQIDRIADQAVHGTALRARRHSRRYLRRFVIPNVFTQLHLSTYTHTLRPPSK